MQALELRAAAFFASLVLSLLACTPGAPDAGAPDAGDPDADAGPSDGGPLDGGDAEVCVPLASSVLPAANSGNGIGFSATVSGNGTFDASSCSDRALAGPERVFALHVAAATETELFVEGDVTASIRTSCADDTTDVICVAGPNEITSGVLEAGDYLVVVDTWRTDEVEFIVWLTPTGTPPPPCLTPTPLAAGVTLKDVVVDDGVPHALAGCTGPVKAHFYAVTVPAQHHFAAEASWNTTQSLLQQRPGLALLTSCPSGCTEGPRSDGPLGFTNPTNSTVTMVLAAFAYDGSEVPAGTTFDVRYTVEPLAVNGQCSAASPLANGDAITGNLSLGSEAGLACGGGNERASKLHYYDVTIGPGETFAANARRLRLGATPWLALLPSCGSTACLAESAQTLGFGADLRYTNDGASALDAVLVVGRPRLTFAPAREPFEVRAGVVAQPTNLECVTAAPVADGDVLLFQDATNATVGLADVCEANATGATLFYEVTVPDGELVTAIVEATGWEALVRQLDGCGATDCVQTAATIDEVAVAPVPPALEWRNETGAPVDVTLAVGPNGAGPAGLFDLRVHVGPPPYEVTPIAADCEDLSGAPPLAGIDDGVDDDSTSATLPLPFAFRYFGDEVTHFGVSANGFLQLFPSVDNNVVKPANINSTLPNPSVPNGVVAALWDDLAPGPLGEVRTHTVGSAPSRVFTVEWRDFSRWNAVGTTAATFQAKLFESSDVVEVHHCAMSGFDPGLSATVGLESLDGGRAARVSYNTAGSVVADTGVRFSPMAP